LSQISAAKIMYSSLAIILRHLCGGHVGTINRKKLNDKKSFVTFPYHGGHDVRWKGMHKEQD
jgi:hypothetical protein